MHPLLWIWVLAGWCVWRHTAAQENSQAAILEKLESLDRRLDRLDNLERRLDTLGQQVTQLLTVASDRGSRRVLQDLREVCDELKGGQTAKQQTPAHVTSDLSATTDDAGGQSHTCPPLETYSRELRVTKVTKEETETSYTLTVCYIAPEKPEVALRFLTMIDRKKKIIQHDGSGVLTLQTNRSNLDKPTELSLELTTRFKGVFIRLRLEENGINETNIPPIQLNAEPGNEVIYVPGTDVDVKCDVTHEIEEDMTVQRYDGANLYLISPSEENTVDEFRLRPNVEQMQDISDIRYTETQHSEGNKTLLLHIPYSPERERGHVMFYTGTIRDCSQGCLVEMYHHVQRVDFYPAGLEGPFPENFVGFVQEKGGREDAEETQKFKCFENNVVKNCLLFCRVFGDHPSMVGITKADGSPTSAHSEFVYHNEYVAFTDWEFESPQLGDAGDYLCQAKSRDGVVITKTMTLSVDKAAEIVEDLTGAVTFENGSLSAVCTAQGRPTPTIRFGLDYSTDHTTVIDEADVTVTQLDNSTSQATLFVADRRKYDVNEIRIYCNAKNNDYGEDRRHMYVKEDLY